MTLEEFEKRIGKHSKLIEKMNSGYLWNSYVDFGRLQREYDSLEFRIKNPARKRLFRELARKCGETSRKYLILAIMRDRIK